MKVNLEEIQERLSNITKGMWKAGAVTNDLGASALFGIKQPGQDYVIGVYCRGEENDRICEIMPLAKQWENAEFIAHAPVDIENLLHRVQELESSLEAAGMNIEAAIHENPELKNSEELAIGQQTIVEALKNA